MAFLLLPTCMSTASKNITGSRRLPDSFPISQYGLLKNNRKEFKNSSNNINYKRRVIKVHRGSRDTLVAGQKCWVQFWGAQYGKEMFSLDRVQPTSTEMSKEMEHFFCEER